MGLVFHGMASTLGCGTAGAYLEACLPPQGIALTSGVGAIGAVVGRPKFQETAFVEGTDVD